VLGHRDLNRQKKQLASGGCFVFTVHHKNNFVVSVWSVNCGWQHGYSAFTVLELPAVPTPPESSAKARAAPRPTLSPFVRACQQQTHLQGMSWGALTPEPALKKLICGCTSSPSLSALQQGLVLKVPAQLDPPVSKDLNSK